MLRPRALTSDTLFLIHKACEANRAIYCVPILKFDSHYKLKNNDFLSYNHELKSIELLKLQNEATTNYKHNNYVDVLTYRFSYTYYEQHCQVDTIVSGIFDEIPKKVIGYHSYYDYVEQREKGDKVVFDLIDQFEERVNELVTVKTTMNPCIATEMIGGICSGIFCDYELR